jgi:hypothetical protein
MRHTALFLLALFAPCHPVPALAQDPVSMPGPHAEPGVWVPLDIARDALGCLDAREPAARQLRLIEAQLELRAARVVELTAHETELRAALEEIEAARVELVTELARPRRRPVMMLSIGFGVGLGVGALLVALVAGGAG